MGANRRGARDLVLVLADGHLDLSAGGFPGLIALDDDHCTRYGESISICILRQLIDQAARYAMRYPLTAAQLHSLSCEFLITAITLHVPSRPSGGRLRGGRFCVEMHFHRGMLRRVRWVVP